MLLVSAQVADTGGPSMMLTIIVAALAAMPGILGFIYSWRKRKDVATATATEFGTQMAKTAFQNMESQVAYLTAEQERWSHDREDWERDRQDLVRKLNDVTDKLQQTNIYLQWLLATLDVHGIQRPVPPSGLSI